MNPDEKVTIRNATEKDLRALARLRKLFIGAKLYKQDVNIIPGRIEKGTTVLLAEIKGRIVGFAWVGSETLQNAGELQSIAVRKGYRRQGIGTLLERASNQFFVRHKLKQAASSPTTKQGRAFFDRLVAARIATMRISSVQKNKIPNYWWNPRKALQRK